jgi:hypothetical protein
VDSARCRCGKRATFKIMPSCVCLWQRYTCTAHLAGAVRTEANRADTHMGSLTLKIRPLSL